jgi:adenosine deaminase
MVDVLDHGFAEAESDGHPTATLCLSLKRDQTLTEAEELVRWMLDRKHPRVSGLSIDGNEADGSNTSRFAGAFEMAARGGLHRCAHAGESSGPEGVREAIDQLGAERIDHGVRAAEDDLLLAELASRQVPLDVCPTSNVVLGLFGSISAHPVDRLLKSGVKLSLNTDDPLLFRCDASGEYLRCAEAFGWSADELGQVARTSIESCFADPDRRQELLVELESFLISAKRPALDSQDQAGSDLGTSSFHL